MTGADRSAAGGRAEPEEAGDIGGSAERAAADDRARSGQDGAGAETSVFDRALPLFEHTHDTLTTAIVVVFATVLGLVAGWITADFGVRLPVYVLAVVGTGYLLYGQPSRRAVLAAGCYSLAALLAVAPLLYELGLVVAVDRPLGHLLSVADLLLVLLFWLVAAVPALVGNRVVNGPFLPRLTARLGG